tara:strand:- start:506 stop:2182 length:1677 start_codon:yes stop_codon:yes gene_type:complete
MPISLDGSGSISGISTFSFSDEIIHTGDTNTAIKFPANDTISFETSGNERLRIDSSGGMGLGTSTIENFGGGYVTLEVAGSTNNNGGVFKSATSGSAGSGSSGIEMLMNTDPVGGSINVVTTHPLKFATANTERARIDTGGHLLVNTTSVGGGSYDQLTVAGGIKITDDSNSKLEIGRYSSSSANSYIKIGTNSASLRITNAADSADLFTFTNSGNLGIGIAAPTSTLYVNGVSTNDIITARAADTNGISVINILAEGTTGHSRIKFSDTAGTDGQISYSHSTRELKLNSAGADRLTFGINAFNSPVFNLGVSSSDSNNHNKGDRTSVKVGDYLNIESPRGAGHNGKAGIGYNCYFHSGEDFYCGTNSPSSGDNRPAAYGMGFGNHYFYSDASNTAHSAQAQLTMTKNMVIHRQGYVTKPNQPSFLVAPANDSQTANGYGVYTTVFHNTGSHYSTSNGRFTAPVTGYYNFGANYVGAAACENVFVRFYINGAVNQRGQHYSGGGVGAWVGSGSPYMSVDLSATHTLLQAGDYVNLHLAATGTTQAQSGYMRFYGYLVH